MNNKIKHSSIVRNFIVTICFMTLFSITMHAQNMTVAGVIVDGNTGEELIGVSVVENGATNGVLSDLDGRFSISVKEGAILTFSYIGYVALELPATANMEVRLQENTTMLDEVVVVGYGIQKKSVVTAAISSVKAEDLGKVAPTRVDNVLRGQVSGVSITQTSGQPGDGSKVRIRGIGTINNSDPLYVIDGMPVEAGIDYLNPADIESVEVLKDAASAAIYGTRGANGVILVTTKTGRSGKASINYNVSYGWQRPWSHRDVLNGEQYMELVREMGGSFDTNTTNANTDWQKAVFNNDAPIVNHQLSVSGGSDKGNYFLSFGYFSQDGIVGGNYGRSNYDRYSVRLNNNYTIFDEQKNRKFINLLTVGTNLSYSRMKSVGLNTNSEYSGILGNALMAPPIYPVIASDADQLLYASDTNLGKVNGVKDANGKYYHIFGDATNEIVNPLATLNTPGTHRNEDKFVTNFWAELTLFKGLKFKSSYGADFNFWGNDYSSGKYYISRTDKLDEERVSSEMNRSFRWQIENTLTYNLSLNKFHNFTVLLGQSAMADRYRDLRGEARGLADPSLTNIDASTSSETARRATGQLHPKHSLASYFGRLSYNFDERYMAEVTVRRDGSSNFGPKNKWATFPSVSAGWNITNEKFMEGKAPWLSSLKLRASWGLNGNESIDPFQYTYLIKPGANYPIGTEEFWESGFTPKGYANPSVKWEKSEQLDFGFDSRFLNGALGFSFDWFKKKTNDMLMKMTIPKYLGAAAPYANVGDMQNTGVEMDLSYQFAVADVNFRIGTNVSYIKNKLIQLGNTEGWENYDAREGETISRAQNGLPFPYFYGKKTDGIFQNQAEIDAYVDKNGNKIQPKAVPGDVRFVDYNGDGKIDDLDRTQIGKGMPDWTYGFNLYVEYKGIDLSANLQGTIGNDIYDATRRLQVTYVNLPSYMLDRWHGEGTSNKYPRMQNGEYKNWSSSDLYVHDGSFLRLRNLQLGYTLPKNIVNKAFIQNLRLHVSAENLFTITSYEGSDPEISASGTSIGIDRGIYPQARTFSVGASVTF